MPALATLPWNTSAQPVKLLQTNVQPDDIISLCTNSRLHDSTGFLLVPCMQQKLQQEEPQPSGATVLPAIAMLLCSITCLAATGR